MKVRQLCGISVLIILCSVQKGKKSAQCANHSSVHVVTKFSYFFSCTLSLLFIYPIPDHAICHQLQQLYLKQWYQVLLIKGLFQPSAQSKLGSGCIWRSQQKKSYEGILPSLWEGYELLNTPVATMKGFVVSMPSFKQYLQN